ncbi:MAG: recombination protein NinB [Epibacterium sp.]|nr:recombination protein NinB [Epibacterium sp.]NQX73958.1 recombination protein NinB [Epibacterium sp.]
MTGPRIITLSSPSNTRAAHTIVDRAAKAGGWTMVVRKEKRTDAQNRLFWSMLGDLSKAEPDGRKHTPEVWKSLIMHAHGYEVRFTMGLNGEPFPDGFRSSQLSVPQMNELMEFMKEYGARYSVKWSIGGE